MSREKMEKENVRQKQITSVLSKYGIYLVLLGMIFILSISSHTFLTLRNIINLLRQISINGVLAIGATFVILTGGIDLSLGSVVALSAVVTASIAHPSPHYPLLLLLLAGFATGLICGCINGTIVSFFNIPPFIATLGMTTIARGLALVITGGRSVINLREDFTALGQDSVWGIPIPVLFFAVIVIIGYIMLHKTRYGRYVFATGGNISAAKASGVNIKATLFSVYAIAGALCGIAGIILSARTNAGSPAGGVGYELDAIAATVLSGTSLSGGKASVRNVIAGVLIIGIIGNGLDILNVSSYIQQIIKGVIIVGAVLLDQMSRKD